MAPSATRDGRRSSALRPLSPAIWNFHFGGHHQSHKQGAGAQPTGSKSDDTLTTPRRSRTFSSPTSPTVASRNYGEMSSLGAWTSGTGSSALPSKEDASFSAYSSPPPSFSVGTKKPRGGILVAASDALNFGLTFSKKRSAKLPATEQQSSHSNSILRKGRGKGKGKWALQTPAGQAAKVLPGVIEITAANSTTVVRKSDEDSEQKERERLREAAAHSIGIAPLIRDDASSRNDNSSFYDETTEEDAEGSRSIHDTPSEHDDVTSGTAAERARTGSLHGSVKTTLIAGLHMQRLHSVTKHHSRRSSATIGPLPPSPSSPFRDRFNSMASQLPPFPCTYGSIATYVQISSMVPKYYPMSTLLLFSLSRQWRIRFMVLTVLPRSKATTSVRSSAASVIPAAFHLHLFKSQAEDECEVERLEINDRSIVFVSEEEVGGRRSVVKVGGADVGAHRKDLNLDERGLTMWHLQILDSPDAQKWITAVKNAVLDQRSEKAGYGIPSHPSTLIEPRGDMDVMLSMRAHGFLGSPVSPQPRDVIHAKGLWRAVAGTTTVDNVISQEIVPSPSPSPTVRSRHIDSKDSSQGSAVSTLRGLFSVASRPRSPSQSSALSFSREDSDSRADPFAYSNQGNSLMSMLRSSTISDKPLSLRHFTVEQRAESPAPSLPSLPSSPLTNAIQLGFARPFVTTHELAELTSLSENLAGANPILRFGEQSLQPPPRNYRRPWTAPGSPNSESGADDYFPGSSSIQTPSVRYGSNGRQSSEGPVAYSPVSSIGTPSGVFGTPEHKAKRTSIASSISSFTSALIDREHSGDSTGSNATRRSRHGRVPKMLTPPTGPPPSIPGSPNSSDNMLGLSQGINASRPASRSSSIQSPNSANLSISSFPSPKRFSGSSAFSSNSFSASYSRTFQPARSHQSPPNGKAAKRASMPPPPRPAPTFALPPTPANGNSELNAATNSKSGRTRGSSLRATLQNRSLRLSMPPLPLSQAPTPNGTSSDARGHRKSTSIGSTNSQTSPLYTIPASPIPSKPLAPPPTGPLPPTPQELFGVSRVKQRLRIRSITSRSPTPVPISTVLTAPTPTLQDEFLDLHATPSPTTNNGSVTAKQNESNFLNMSNDSPSTSSSTFLDGLNFLNMSSPSPIPTYSQAPTYAEDGSPDAMRLMSLSPPPRRETHLMSPHEEEYDDHYYGSTDGTPVTPSSLEDDLDHKMIPHRDSAVSLGLFTID